MQQTSSVFSESMPLPSWVPQQQHLHLESQEIIESRSWQENIKKMKKEIKRLKEIEKEKELKKALREELEELQQKVLRKWLSRATKVGWIKCYTSFGHMPNLCQCNTIFMWHQQPLAPCCMQTSSDLIYCQHMLKWIWLYALPCGADFLALVFQDGWVGVSEELAVGGGGERPHCEYCEYMPEINGSVEENIHTLCLLLLGVPGPPWKCWESLTLRLYMV